MVNKTNLVKGFKGSILFNEKESGCKRSRKVSMTEKIDQKHETRRMSCI